MEVLQDVAEGEAPIEHPALWVSSAWSVQEDVRQGQDRDLLWLVTEEGDLYTLHDSKVGSPTLSLVASLSHHGDGGFTVYNDPWTGSEFFAMTGQTTAGDIYQVSHPRHCSSQASMR